MKVTALSPINHDGMQYAPGETFKAEGAALAQLLENGVVEAAGVTSARAVQNSAAAKAAEEAAAADEQVRAQAAAAAAADKAAADAAAKA